MDQENDQKTPFQDVVAFMDVKDYTTLTLWLHNPVICDMQCIAYMDCESKNATNIALFLTLVKQNIAGDQRRSGLCVESASYNDG